VFITYAHDSAEHKDLVNRLGTFLRTEVGVDVHLDQWYETERRDWSLWAVEQLTKADFIIVIASPDYRRRVDCFEPIGEGWGARFEAAIVRDNLARDLPAETRRVLPVVLSTGSVCDIPAFLCAYSTTYYVISEFSLTGIRELLAVFNRTNRMPSLGEFIGDPFADRRNIQARTKALLITTLMRPCKVGVDISFGAAELNGTHFGNSIVHRCTPRCREPRSDIEYNLGRRYRTFEAHVGVLDDARDANQTGYFQVFLDGAAQPQHRVEHGQPALIRHDVSGRLRLRLVAYRPDTLADQLPELAWGDPTLYE
jgi:hypothetical protein